MDDSQKGPQQANSGNRKAMTDRDGAFGVHVEAWRFNEQVSVMVVEDE